MAALDHANKSLRLTSVNGVPVMIRSKIGIMPWKVGISTSKYTITSEKLGRRFGGRGIVLTGISSDVANIKNRIHQDLYFAAPPLHLNVKELADNKWLNQKASRTSHQTFLGLNVGLIYAILS